MYVITRPEQLMSAMINAMRVLTDTANCGTAVISLKEHRTGTARPRPGGEPYRGSLRYFETRKERQR